MSSISKIKTNNILYNINDTSKQGLLIPGEGITIENNVISANGASYVLPVATSQTLGGIKIGDNLSIDNVGRVSASAGVIFLLTDSMEDPSAGQEGDKYYNLVDHKIYIYSDGSWGNPEDPKEDTLYLNRYSNILVYWHEGVGYALGYVSRDSSEVINGVKFFNSLPESSVTPTTNNQLVNKKYVDDAISSSITNALEGSY